MSSYFSSHICILCCVFEGSVPHQASCRTDRLLNITGQENVNSLFVESVFGQSGFPPRMIFGQAPLRIFDQCLTIWPVVINMLTVPKCRAVQLLSNVSHIVSFFPCNSP